MAADWRGTIAESLRSQTREYVVRFLKQRLNEAENKIYELAQKMDVVALQGRLHGAHQEAARPVGQQQANECSFGALNGLVHVALAVADRATAAR